MKMSRCYLVPVGEARAVNPAILGGQWADLLVLLCKKFFPPVYRKVSVEGLGCG